MYFAQLPRVALATLPTTLQPADRLSAALGGQVRVWIKRDDNTGLALGGNKARKLEFLVGEALEKGCDTLITTGGPQSNHCRMTAAAAAKAGMHCHLVFSGPVVELRQANLLLDELLGAKLHFPGALDVEATSREMSRLAESLHASGYKSHIIPLGGSDTTGALGYVNAVREMLMQAEDANVQFDAIFHASGSGGTQAGILAGLALHHMSTPVFGISVSRPSAVFAPQVERLTSQLMQRLGLESAPQVAVDDSFVGGGYGIPTVESDEALQLAAKTEGLIIDPVYTAKAMAGLIAAVRAGRFAPGGNILFWHTGGSPALFADKSHWEGKSI